MGEGNNKVWTVSSEGRYETSKLPQHGETRIKEMCVRFGEFRHTQDQIQCQWNIQMKESVGGWIYEYGAQQSDPH